MARVETIVSDLLSESVLRFSIILWLGAVIIALGQKPATRRTLIGMGATAAGLLVQLTAVYLASPHDLLWHLGTSTDRLHIHPSMVWTTGALVGIIGGWSAVGDRRKPAAEVDAAVAAGSQS